MTRAKDISKIITDADFSGTLDVTGTVTTDGNLLVGTNTNAVYYNSVSTYNASAVIKTSTSNDVADLVLVNGDNNFGSTIDFARTNTSSNDVRFAIIGGYVDSNTAGSESGNIRLSTKDTGDSNIVERMRILSNGDISFYEDTGTTPKLFWDASAERLGIGTSSPSSPLSLGDGASSITTFDLSGTNTGQDALFIVTSDETAGLNAKGNSIGFGSPDGHSGRKAAISAVQTDASDRDFVGLAFHTHNSASQSADMIEAMRITADGKVGIGINSPTQKLEVSGKGVFSTANPDVNGLKITATTGTNASAMQFTNAVNGYVGLDNSTGGRFGSDNYGLVMYQGSGYPITFHTNGTKRMTIDANGHVTMPYQPAFSVKPSSNQTNISVGSAVDVVFDSEFFDVGSNFASNTFTAPVTGKYQLNVRLYLNTIDTASAYYILNIVTSNYSYVTILDPNFSADVDYYTMNSSVLADMDANDTAKIRIHQNNGTAQTDITGADSGFSGILVA